MTRPAPDRRDSAAPPGTPRRVALLLVLLAGLMGWLALGHGAELPWQRRFYLPAHTFMEVLSVVVAAMVFSTGWHSFDGRTPRGVALLSPAFLAVGLLDFGHLMSVPGMPGLDGPGTVEKGIAFWLPARGIAALALLAAALAPEPARAGRGTRRVLLVLSLAAGALGYWLALLRPDLLPATFVPGRGLTEFKVGTEYAFMAVSALAAWLLLRRARANGSAANWYLFTAAAINAISVVSFTLYRDADDIFNLAGHLYKVFMDLCLYRAIFVVAVQDPYLRLRRSERSLFESETRFRSLMEAAPDAIVMSDARGRIAMMNACAESLFGVPRRAATGIPVGVLVPPQEDGSDEVACRRAHGDPFPAEVRRSRVSSSGEELDIAIVRDLSERRKLEKALLEQLTHDALTGLPNRRRILEALAEAITAARVGGHMLAVLVFDIDQFKKVNNSFGYADGDAVLRECVRRISSALRPGDTLARQGGNEFIILQKNVAREAEVAALADTLLAHMREPFSPRGQQVFLSASVGIALMPEEEVRPQELLHRAQVAMGAARAEGEGRYRFHTGEMERTLRERVSLEAFLRHAVERGELAVQYQPRVSMNSGEMVGVEALVRWRHPTLGLVPPGRFIPIAEETGLIEEIDMWVLREACTRAAAWQAEGLAPVRVSVNLSARQFQHEDLAQRVRAVLEQTGLAPRYLELEITESTVMDDIDVARKALHALKEVGVALSIDDFGTGYSSLSYLKRFPIDVLKVDRSFITDVMNDPNDAAIVRAIIALAHGLDLEAVAEGVETMEQVTFLKANGCDEIQGYYYSPPVWPERLAVMLDSGMKENFIPEANLK